MVIITYFADVLKKLYKCVDMAESELYVALMKYHHEFLEGKLSKMDVEDLDTQIDHLKRRLFELRMDIATVYIPDLLYSLESIKTIAETTNNKRLYNIAKKEIEKLRKLIEEL